MSVKIIDKVREYLRADVKNFETFKTDVEALLTAGANIDEFDNYGTNPLLSLAFKGSFEDVKFIVSKGANLDVVDNWGYTSLFASLLDKKLDQAKFIIDSGVNINYVDNKGNSYLDNCLDFNLLDLGKYLFDKNAISNKYSMLEIMIKLGQNKTSEQ